VQVTRLYTDDAELYDIAFDWDVNAEVEWLLERLGPACRSVFEPGCGSGRMLEAFSSHGLEVVGIDSSSRMVTLARARLGGLGSVHVADMTSFDLGRSFDGAVSPINTLLHLTPPELQPHLEALARHLKAGAHYLVQVGLADPKQREPFAGSHWEARRGDTHLRIRCRSYAAFHPVRMMFDAAGIAMMVAMRPVRNWAWALGTLVIWVAIFFAFLLIAIPRH
jgi:SAM-dependent methyltransferase